MAIDRFLAYLKFEKRYSSHTLTSYTNDLSQFYAFLQQEFNVEKIQEVTHYHIRAWIVDLMNRDISPRSVNRKISSLKSYYKFLNREGVVESNPTIKITAPKVSKRLPEFVEQQRMDTLLNHVDFGEGFSAIRDRTIIEVLYCTGMRRAELIGLKEQDIDFSTRLIKVLGKGNKERLIPFDDQLQNTLNEYLEAKEQEFESEWLLVTDKGKQMYPALVYKVVKHFLSLVTTQGKRSPHILRHSFATHLSNNGADLNAIKELLGHSSLAATQVYTHNNIEQLKNIYKQSHPKA